MSSHVTGGEHGLMQASASLHVRRLLERDAPAYSALRRRSIDGLIQPVEPEVRRELCTGSAGMAVLLSEYTARGTQVWGAFVDDVIVATAALSRCRASTTRCTRAWACSGASSCCRATAARRSRDG